MSGMHAASVRRPTVICSGQPAEGLPAVMVVCVGIGIITKAEKFMAPGGSLGRSQLLTPLHPYVDKPTNAGQTESFRRQPGASNLE